MFKPNLLNRALMLAFGGSLALGAGLAQGQDSQRIEITGSSIKRVDAEGALPVTVVTKEDIARSGVSNTEELMQTISSIGSLNGVFNATGAGSSTAGQATISLRGLSGSRTLVLVNGRRIAAGFNGASQSSAVNVNNIPLAAIERVEVLKDGASSIYGSEALAGVVNFILTKEFQGVDIGVKYGQPTRSGGGENKQASIVAGFGNLAKDRFNVTLSASLDKENALFAADRGFAKSGNNFPYTVAGATGQGNIEGWFNPGTGSAANGTWVEGTRVTGFGNSPGAGYGNPLAAQDKCADINMFKNPTNSAKGAPYCTFDSNAFVGLVPEREATNLTLNGAFRVSDALELFGDALFTKSTVIQRFQPSPLRRDFMTSDGQFQTQGVDPVLLVQPGTAAYTFATDYLRAQGFGSQVDANANLPLAVTARVFDFGSRTNKDKTEQSRLVLGARGEVAGQSYELAYSDNKYELSGSVPDGYFSQVKYAKAVQGAADYNPWSLTLSDSFKQAIAGAKYTGATLDGTAKAKVFDGKLSGDVAKLPGGFLSYAVGAQYRDESLQTRPSEALFSGDIAGLGGATPPVDKSRKITSMFAELVAPVLKGLEANVAARHDRYNDVGNADTYKASLRYQPVKAVLIRAGHGTGFRAPMLSELWLPQTVGTSEQFTDPAFPNNSNLQVQALTGGNPNLKPEKSKQSTIGVVLQPIDAFSASIDYWRINVNGIITTPSAQEIVSRYRQGDAAYQGLVTLNSNGEVDQIKSVLANVGSAKLEGIDVDANVRVPVPAGRLDVNLNGTYMIRYDQTSPGGTISRKVGTMVEADGTPVLGADGGGVVLRWKHRLAATYTTGPWAVTLAQNFYTGYRTGDRQLDGEPNYISNQALYDLNVAFTGIKNLRLALGVKNLFDKDPPIYVPASNQFQAGYDISLYDPRARTVYLTANYRF